MLLGNFLKKIKDRINKWLSEKKTPILPQETSSIKSQPAVTSNSGPRTPGLDCPRCSYRIVTTMEMLISGQAIYCKACGLKISINHEESKDCLNEVKKLHEAVKKVEKVKAEVGKK